MLYLDAASGTLHGVHVGHERRGEGLLRSLYVYYCAFCGYFGLEAVDTAKNKKPAFAKLFAGLGYRPESTDFPFLLLPRAAAAGGEQTDHAVVPLATADGHAAWSFSPSFAASQGLVVLEGDAAERAAAAGASSGGLLLYAHTAWRLADADALAARDAAVARLVDSRRVRCVVYV